ARALDYIHTEGIVHRNVNPKNILRDAPTQTYKLGNLMLAKAQESDGFDKVTRQGQLVGAVSFMSPEHTRDSDVIDARSDLYGLGATTYALLTGRPPCDGKTLIEQITRIRQVTPDKPTKSQMSIPSMFEGVVMKLLAKDPKDRFQTATALVA